MAAISELIRTEGNGTLSFGDYTLGAKAKLDNYEFHGDKYKVKTFKEITKLERNGLFVYESVPGTAVTNFTEDENTVSFTVEGPEDAQITLELAEETEYEIDIDGKSAGTMKTNLGGKLSLSVELEGADAVAIRVEKEIIYGKSKNQCVFFARIADMNHPNGWASVRHAESGTRS